MGNLILEIEKMNTYPFIGKFQSAVEMFFNHGRSMVIESGHGTGRHESKFKNITTEYLANTYGEVKSKEHAEFIVKLNSGHNGLVSGSKSSIAKAWSDKIKYFIIDGTGKLCFSNNVYSIDKAGKREITIPLPPESNVNTPEEDFEMKQVAKNNGDNLIFGDADKYKGQVPESDYNELLKRFDHMCDLHGQLSTITQLLMHDGVDVEKLLNIGTDGYNMPHSKDYMDWRKHTITALTNVINVGESNCKEWPCVNDEVLINIDFDKYDVKYGKEVNGENGVVRSIFKDGDATVYAVSVDGACYCFVRGLLQKPKTPEQELRDEIIEVINKDVYKGVYSKEILSAFADALMSKFEITKKPQ